MKILAIDTSSQICSTAILEDDKLIDKNELDNGRTHSENLMPLIEELLKRNNISINDIELLACSVGPGSFTGIRIGVATLKPIAEVLDKKIASVTSLEILAENVESSNEEITIVSLIDAKNSQVYCGIFNNNYELKEDYIADDINNIIEILKKHKNIIFVGNGAIIHREILKEEFKIAIFEEKNEQSVENVGKIGYRKYLKNDLKTADTLIPIYLKKSQAERMKK